MVCHLTSHQSRRDPLPSYGIYALMERVHDASMGATFRNQYASTFISFIPYPSHICLLLTLLTYLQVTGAMFQVTSPCYLYISIPSHNMFLLLTYSLTYSLTWATSDISYLYWWSYTSKSPETEIATETETATERDGFSVSRPLLLARDLFLFSLLSSDSISSIFFAAFTEKT